jgi:hypothetical protein
MKPGALDSPALRGGRKFFPPYEGGERWGEFEAGARGNAAPKNPPVSPLRKGGQGLAFARWSVLDTR